ncbi:MAG: 50S ribosomal protein L4 [bacterium]|nr:50S ribosomal protein L4 [bacterium]
MPTKKIKNPASPAKRGEQKSKIKNTSKNSKVSKKEIEKKTVEATVKVSKKISGLKAEVFDIKGKVLETIDLPSTVFGAKINNQLISQAVRIYLANQRRGTSKTKTRGEVQGSSRKIYKQKGTGRARHGSVRAPIFVHGGVAFGPRPRDYSLNFPQKMKKAALFSALSLKHKNGEIKIVSGLEKITPKTKIMNDVIEKLSLNVKGNKILVILPSKTENIQRAARNIEGVELTLVNQLNTYEILRNKTLLFLKDSMEFFNKPIVKGK